MYAVQDAFTCMPHDCEIAADGSLVMFVSTYILAKEKNMNESQNLLARGDPCRHAECYVTSCVPVIPWMPIKSKSLLRYILSLPSF
jgi:hypothetical protein